MKKRTKIADVAEAAGVSTATVSRFLNNKEALKSETQVRVQSAIDELGYIPDMNARALASGKRSLYGAVIPTMENAIFAEGMEAMQAWLTQRNATLMVVSSGYDPTIEFEQVKRLISHDVAGLLLIGRARPPETTRFIKEQGIPFCTSWSFKADTEDAQIGFNNYQAAYDMGQLIYQKGHKSIGIIGGLTHWNDRAQDRIAGISDFFKSVNLEIPQAQILEAAYKPEDAAEAFEVLTNLNKGITAVFCGNDVLSAGAIMKARAMGIRVPEDVSITGFDDIALASVVHPTLTTIHLPHRYMGEMAAKALWNAVNLDEPVQSVEIPFTIRQRESLIALEDSCLF